MELFLSFISIICWTIFYIEVVYLGFKEKTYGIPFIPLALNFSWILIHSYIGLTNNFFSIQTWINIAWFILNLLILCTYLMYGKYYFPKYTSKEYFLPWSIIIIIMSFTLQYFFIIEFNALGKIYSTFIQNLIMSILFINMLVQRSDLKGQHLIIAISKWIACITSTLLFVLLSGSKLVLALGTLCSIFDIIYIYFLRDIRKTLLKLSNKSSFEKTSK